VASDQPVTKQSTDSDVVGSGRQATSVDKAPPQSSLAVSSSTHNYFAKLAPGSDNDADFDFGFDLDDSHNKNKSSSSPYSTLTYARQATIHSASQSFSQLAQRQLNKMKITQRSEHEIECCADSGATKHMILDYSAFVSYHKCTNQMVKLADESVVPILGYSTTKFSLNGKIILVRDALHVSALSAPLYLLRQHHRMPGCGFFSHHDSGAFLFFPHFTLKIDDTEDCILNFKPIGKTPTSPIDYAQPQDTGIHAAARTANLNPPDDSDTTSLTRITYHVPDPKARPLPPESCTPSTTHLTMTSPLHTTASQDLDSTTFEATALKLLSKCLFASLHSDPMNLSDILPAYTAAACENRKEFDGLKLHKIFGCRRFKSQSYLIAASKNASPINTGEFSTTLGNYATMDKPAQEKTLTKRRKYLEKVHLDIVFGDCLALGGYRYGLLLVDVATRYTWFYGLTSLTNLEIISGLKAFASDAGGYPKRFHADFDQIFIGGAALRHINKHSKIIAAPSHQQSSNGLVESTWKTLIRPFATKRANWLGTRFLLAQFLACEIHFR